MGGVKLFHGDCLKVMKLIPSESIDLVVTDPPYLMNYKTHYRLDKTHDFCSTIKNDDNEDVIIKSLQEIYRVLRPNSAMYMFCNSNKIDVFKQAIEEAGFKIKNIIVWVKNNWTAGDLKAQFGKQYEFIILANKGRKPFNGKRITDVWYFDKIANQNLIHQNQKPVPLLKQCIEKHSNENDVVLDCFMGSGSTVIAAVNNNRKCIGIELDDKYFELACNRVKAHLLVAKKLGRQYLGCELNKEYFDIAKNRIKERRR